jgi:hypothetical protein
LLLNGFEIELPSEVEVLVRPMANPADVRPERERLSGYWFVHWWGGNLYGLRLRGGGPNVTGDSRTMPVGECLWLMRARLDDVIASVFERYHALRYRPFTFLAQREEIIGSAAKRANVPNDLLNGFRIFPKFKLHAKVVEARDGDLKLGLFIEVGMRYEANASLEDLQGAGVDLSGLFVVRREVQPGQRRFAGRLDRVENGTVFLSAGDRGFESISLQRGVSNELWARTLRRSLRPVSSDRRNR